MRSENVGVLLSKFCSCAGGNETANLPKSGSDRRRWKVLSQHKRLDGYSDMYVTRRDCDLPNNLLCATRLQGDLDPPFVAPADAARLPWSKSDKMLSTVPEVRGMAAYRRIFASTHPDPWTCEVLEGGTAPQRDAFRGRQCPENDLPIDHP